MCTIVSTKTFHADGLAAGKGAHTKTTHHERDYEREEGEQRGEVDALHDDGDQGARRAANDDDDDDDEEKETRPLVAVSPPRQTTAAAAAAATIRRTKTTRPQIRGQAAEGQAVA